VKIALALAAIVLAGAGGAVLEEKLEWRACRALSFFDQPASPALAQFKVHRPPERQHVQLAERRER
jgi:hypothetical protein